MTKFVFIPYIDLVDLYERTLEVAKERVPAIMDSLQIHDMHKPSIGYWPATAVVVPKALNSFSLPSISNALVVPFYDNELNLTHIRLIYNTGNKFSVQSIGTTPNGWFNLPNSSRHYSINQVGDPTKRLSVYGSLLKALSKDNGVSSDIVNQKNMNFLGQIAARLAVTGDKSWLDKFKFINNFDIKVGQTETSITEFSFKSFCFEELAGLDMRYIIPKALNYVKELPFYEREQFNKEFVKIFKLDLRNVSPLLFEHQLNEKRLMGVLKSRIENDFDIQSAFNEGIEIEINRKAKKTQTYNFKLTEKNISEFLSMYYGDLLDFCQQSDIGGLPAQYIYEIKENVRLPRPQTYSYLCKIIYMIILDIIRKE